MSRNYKRNGLTHAQGLNIGDAVADAHHGGIQRHPIKCPVCGKRTSGMRPEGYQHPGFKPGIETTYCKVNRGNQHEGQWRKSGGKTKEDNE